MKNKKPKLTQLLAKVKPHWWLLAVLALAVFFRFWQLNSLPPGLHPDEAANGLDIFRMFNGDLRVVYDTNGPREALFFYLQAPFVYWLKNTALALRLAPAIIGVLAVWVTYLWSKEWFDRKTAILSGFFYAIGVWAITLSRDGFRANLVPLVIALNAWTTTKAIRTKKWQWAALSGISYAAGLYTYFSYRLVFLALVACLVLALIKYRDQLKSLGKQIAVAIVAGAICLVPLGIYALDHPGEVLVGRSSVAFTNPDLNGGQPWQTLGQTVVKTALMFNFEGDPNYRHNLGGAPMLGAATGIFFLLGVLLALRKINDIRYFGLMAIFGAMLLPEIVTAEGIPHGLRAIGVLPVVYILAAVGLRELISRFNGVFPRNLAAKSFMYTVIGVTLATSVVYSYQRYFVAWANAPETFEAYSEDAVAISSYLNSQPDPRQDYVVAAGYSNITISYLTHKKADYTLVEPHQIDNITPGPTDRVLVAASEDQKWQAYLVDRGMQLTRSEVKSETRPNVVLFTVYEKL